MDENTLEWCIDVNHSDDSVNNFDMYLVRMLRHPATLQLFQLLCNGVTTTGGAGILSRDDCVDLFDCANGEWFIDTKVDKLTRAMMV